MHAGGVPAPPSPSATAPGGRARRARGSTDGDLRPGWDCRPSWGDTPMRRSRNAFALLQAANPIPVEQERRRPSLLKMALVGAAIVMTFLLVAPAVGIGVPPLDFWSAEKAPPKVVEDFESLSEGAPPGMDPGAIPGETRKVPRADGSALWVGPTKHGGFCTLGTRGGGCDQRGTFPLSVTWGATGSARVPRTGPPAMTAFTVLQGHANSRYVDSVEIRFADGDVERPKLTWVSEPIHQGFFAYQVPAEHRRPGHEIEEVVGLDEDGGLIVDATRPEPELLREVPRDAVFAEREERARISTLRGQATIWEAPTRYEGRCAWLELPGRVLQLMPCMPKGYPYGLFAIRFVPTAENVLVAGWAAKRYSSVEVVFADGSRMVLEPRSGFLLGEVPARNLVRGREAVAVIGRGATGRELQPRITVGEAYSRVPCFGPLPNADCP